MSEHQNYSINKENYLQDYEYECSIDYIFKYIELIHQYLNYCKENMFIQDLKLNKYIIIKGLELLNTTFNILLLYTKNLDLTFYNAQKAYCYYVEFIGQIGDENNSFLKLNTKDAILFIHRKVLYNIDNNVRKEFKISDEHSKMLMKVKNYSTIYNNLIFKTIDKCELPFQKNDDTVLKTIIKMNTTLINKYINNDDHLFLIEKCDYLLTYILDFDVDVFKIYSILETFIKKYKKLLNTQTSTTINEIVEKNISNIDFREHSTIKLINKLFSV